MTLTCYRRLKRDVLIILIFAQCEENKKKKNVKI